MNGKLNEELKQLREKLGTNFVRDIDASGNQIGLQNYLKELIKFYKDEINSYHASNPHVTLSVKKANLKVLKRYLEIVEEQENEV